MTQCNDLICNLERYIELEYTSALIAQAKNTKPNVNKWLSNIDIRLKWSNLLWDTSWIAQIMQTLKFRFGCYLGNYCKKHILHNNKIYLHFATFAHLAKTTHAYTCLQVAITHRLKSYKLIDTTKAHKSTLIRKMSKLHTTKLMCWACIHMLTINYSGPELISNMWMPMNVANSILFILKKIVEKNSLANSYGCNRLSSSPKWAYK